SPYWVVRTFFDGINESDIAKVESTFSDRLEYRILPKSLERPVMSKKLYRQYFTGMRDRFPFKELRMITHEVVEYGRDSVTVHGTTKGMSLNGTPYDVEFVMIIHFEPSDGKHPPKILLVKEFTDSRRVIDFFTEEKAK
ncbi:hypothetical protein FISHEDRAFT_31666, partial [Fistulina hepatica ATCC 64428]